MRPESFENRRKEKRMNEINFVHPFLFSHQSFPVLRRDVAGRNRNIAAVAKRDTIKRIVGTSQNIPVAGAVDGEIGFAVAVVVSGNGSVGSDSELCSAE